MKLTYTKVNQKWAHPIVWENGKRIATIDGYNLDGMNHEETAKFFASTYDLLNALKDVALDLEYMKEDAQSASIRHHATESLKLVKAAITKAERK